jgi:hypothetical protein
VLQRAALQLSISGIAHEIAAEWKRVPMLPTSEHFDRAWSNILKRACVSHGEPAVKEALELIRGGLYNGTVPHEWTLQ